MRCLNNGAQPHGPARAPAPASPHACGRLDHARVETPGHGAHALLSASMLSERSGPCTPLPRVPALRSAHHALLLAAGTASEALKSNDEDNVGSLQFAMRKHKWNTVGWWRLEKLTDVLPSKWTMLDLMSLQTGSTTAPMKPSVWQAPTPATGFEPAEPSFPTVQQDTFLINGFCLVFARLVTPQVPRFPCRHDPQGRGRQGQQFHVALPRHRDAFCRTRPCFFL